MGVAVVSNINMRPVPGLEKLVDDLPNDITMIEIGSFAGESTETFIKSGKIKKIIIVEPWDDDVFVPMELKGTQVQRAFNSRIKRLTDSGIKMPEIVIAKRFSADASRLLNDGEYDFVYIDGDHSYKGVVEDIKNYLPKLKSNGILAGHDYYPNEFFSNDKLIHTFPDVPPGVDKMIGKPDKVYPDTSWMIKVENIKRSEV